MQNVPTALLTLLALPGRGGGFSVVVRAGGRAWLLKLSFFFCTVKSPSV